MNPVCVSIGPIPKHATVHDIVKLCSICGYVENCNITKKNIAYVIMKTPEEARYVYEKYSGYVLQGKLLETRFILREKKSTQYIILQVHYLSGKYEINAVQSKEELRGYLIGYLKYYNISYKQNCSLEHLITTTVNHSRRVIDEEIGYGIVAVIKGKIM